MASILEALEMAQERNKQRDAMNAQRQMPVLPIIPTGEVQPIRLDTGGGDGPPMVDTRTPHEMYLDAIDVNQWAGAVPVVGTVIGALNDNYIANYERENPDKVVGGGVGKYSMLGRAGMKGLTAEEQVQAKREGLGFSKMLTSDGPAPAGYSLLDRITGNVPINWATQADYIGSFPEGTAPSSSGWETGGGGDNNGPPAAQGTTNFGGRESSVSYDDYSGYA